MPVSSECQHLFPTKIVSRLVKWAAIPYEDYAVGAGQGHLPPSSRAAPAASHSSSCLSSQELPYTKDVIEAGLAEDTHLYYMALIERGTGRRLSFPWQLLFPAPDAPGAASGGLWDMPPAGGPVGCG